MDRRERIEDANVAMQAVLEGWQTGIWTALPAIVESFDPAAMTIKATIAIQMRVRNPAGDWSWVTVKPIVDVPVCFPNGGGYSLTFPIAAGDEALVVFASRCIDSWWQSGGVQVQAEIRFHDLSDGFAIIGPRSQPRKITGISDSAVQLRSDDGDTYVEIDGTQVKIKAATVVIDSPQTTCTGALTVDGLLTYQNGLAGNGGGSGSVIVGPVTQSGGAMKSNGITVSTHTHGGVQVGGGTTAGPNP